MDDYYNLGSHSCPVTTTSPDAQLWFDRGLIWTYAYNHAEATVCFNRALEHDPACAMAHWGIAYATGPNYNMPWELYDATGRAAGLNWPMTQPRRRWPWPTRFPRPKRR